MPISLLAWIVASRHGDLPVVLITLGLLWAAVLLFGMPQSPSDDP